MKARKVLSTQTVFDATLDRIGYLFDEFPNIVCGISGGKDSTVVLELCLRVARERGRLPLTVFFLDQEAEWTATEDHVREVMYRPEVKPLWFQMPIHLDNATSFDTKFLKCWDPKAEADWVHPRDPVSIKENRYGTDRFAELFPAIFRVEYPGQKVAVISGVRCEESPARLMGLTGDPSYKWVTWAKKLTPPDQFTFYPIYDWGYRDVWTAIFRENWPYNKIYDLQYRYGVNIQNMRVSNLHHETAVRSLFHLQEVDPPLYERLAKRLPGVDTAGKLGQDFYAKKLPYMFKSWCEYRDYLTQKLVAADDPWRGRLVKLAAKWDGYFASNVMARERAAATIVNSILCNDYRMTKTENFRGGFVTKYREDRADAAWGEGDALTQAADPISFKMFINRFRQHGVPDPDGRVYYCRGRYKYWIENEDTVRRLDRFAEGGVIDKPVLALVGEQA